MEFLRVASMIGSVFAMLTFALTAFSLPLIADRQIDVVTACVSSVNAVVRNKPAMIFCGLLIAVLTALGIATALIGLALVMPWLAYASWHAYRETRDPQLWPEIKCQR